LISPGHDVRFLKIFSLLLCLAGFPTAASVHAGEEVVATVVVVRGIVTASTPKGAVRPLQRQDAVFLSDTIKTGENAKAQFLFKDQTLITLGPKGELKIRDYAWQEQEKKGRLNVAINEGAFRVLGGLITKHAPQNFKAETPAATIGIRGSSFAGAVHGDRLDVVFLGGKGIFVANQAGRVDISTPMQGTQVTTGSAPHEPVPWSSDDLAPLRVLGVWIGPLAEVQVIVNQSDNRGAANIAVGAGNRANLGSVAVEQSRLKGPVINQTDNRNAVNAAIGTGNAANLGAADLQKTTLKGAIINQSANQGASNLAIGTGNEANTGSVKIE